MDLYNSILFLHILGAMGLFVALGLEWTSLRPMRRAASSEDLHIWLRVLGPAGRLGPASMAILLLTGFYMTAALRARMAWVMVSMGAIVAMAILGGALTGRRMATIRRQLAASGLGPLSPELRRLVQQPVLWVSLQLRMAIFLGIVFLMTIKPAMLASLLVLAVAAALALATSPILWRSTTAGVSSSEDLAA